MDQYVFKKMREKYDNKLFYLQEIIPDLMLKYAEFFINEIIFNKNETEDGVPNLALLNLLYHIAKSFRKDYDNEIEKKEFNNFSMSLDDYFKAYLNNHRENNPVKICYIFIIDSFIDKLTEKYTYKQVRKRIQNRLNKDNLNNFDSNIKNGDIHVSDSTLFLNNITNMFLLRKLNKWKTPLTRNLSNDFYYFSFAMQEVISKYILNKKIMVPEYYSDENPCFNIYHTGNSKEAKTMKALYSFCFYTSFSMREQNSYDKKLIETMIPNEEKFDYLMNNFNSLKSNSTINNKININIIETHHEEDGDDNSNIDNDNDNFSDNETVNRFLNDAFGIIYLNIQKTRINALSIRDDYIYFNECIYLHTLKDKKQNLYLNKDYKPIIILSNCDTPKTFKNFKILEMIKLSMVLDIKYIYVGVFQPYCQNGECAKVISSKIKLLKCGGCGMRWYCSRKCQKKKWKDHKQCCKINRLMNLNDKSYFCKQE